MSASPRKPGRPVKAEPGSTVCTWLPASEHDRLVRIADARNMSVSKLVKAYIVKSLQKQQA